MTVAQYVGILKRRWYILAVIILLNVIASGYLFLKAHRHIGFQACTTLLVQDANAPGITLGTTQQDQLLSGEVAANFFADDVLDVAQTSGVAAYVSRILVHRNLPNTSAADISGNVTGARKDRTVDLCVTNPGSAPALAISSALGRTLTTQRERFFGRSIAKRTYVSVASPPSVGPAPTGRASVSFLLRLALGVLAAAAVAFLWDVLDPRVRDDDDVSRALGAPVLARV